MAGSKKALGILFGVKGGSSISADSGKLILQDLTKIVNQINNNQKLLPKVVLQIDTSKSIKSINKLHKAVKSLQQQTQNINTPNGGKNGKSSAYTQNLAEAKKYFKELKALQKAAARTADVNADEKTGSILGINGSNYANHYAYFQGLEKKYQSLAGRLNKSGQAAANEAKSLGITIDEYNELSKVIAELSVQSGIAFDKIKIDASAAWQKQASNISDSIHRVYDTISKDPAVKRLADNILEMTKRGAGNVDELKQKFQEFNLAARQSGADVETWGQKFKKAFAGHIRSALAGLITADVSVVLRDVYNNVVALDDAVVNLQIASGKSRNETKALVKEYASLAKQLKATTAEVAESADTWLRQGYSAAQATALIANSTMLAKLGQMEASDASTALTSAMKGYKVSVKDSVNVVDKLTAVDMEAAASAGGIATAMAETAASANLAGVSMDTLIGYIATVKEVTQDADESVGNFFKTMLARMGNIKVGKFVDEDGESLNDVETVLGEVGIKLRSANDQFRDFSEVLDEVGAKWDGYNEVQKHAIATAIAGTKQQEKFLTLMSNYETALGYAETAANSAGTAIKKYEAYTNSVTGAVQGLKAAFEELSLASLDSDIVIDMVNFGTGILDVLNSVMSVVDAMGGLKTVLVAVLGIVFSSKYSKIISNLGKIKASLIGIGNSVLEIIANFAVARASGMGWKDSINAAFSSIKQGAISAKTAITGVTIAVTALVAIYNAYLSSKEKSIATNLTDAATHLENAQTIKKEAESLAGLISEYNELAQSHSGAWDATAAEKIRELQDQITDLVGDQAQNIDIVNGKLKDQKTILDEIAEKNLEKARDDVSISLANTELAYKEKVSTDRLTLAGALKYQPKLKGALYQSKNDIDALKAIASEFELAITESSGYSGTSAGIKFDFSNNIEEFVSQYRKALAAQAELANGRYRSSAEMESVYKSISNYVSEYEEFYSKYTSALQLSEELAKKAANNSVGDSQEPAGKNINKKSVIDILNDVQPAYDAISKALADLGENGMLTADALSSLFELEEDGKIGGIETAKLITETAEGYKLATDALEQYVSALVNRAIAETKVNYADEASKKNAIKNLETLMSVLATLSAVQEGAPDPVDALNAEKDVLDDQLDRYKELIDLRKDLIETYADELEYQRELEKKQQKVASLQTKLTVARLDNSAAGQARVRELESQLKDAQEDLEDFTLEHAIDEILDGLDNQYSEYENFIKKELEKIEAKLDALKNPDSIEIAGLDTYLAQIRDAIIELNKPDELSLDKMFEQWQSAYNQAVWGTGGDPDDQKLYEKAWEDISNLWNLGNKSRAKSVLDQLLNGTYVPDYSETEEEETEADVPVIKDEQIGLLGTEIGQKIADAVSAWLNRDSSDDTTEPPAVAEALDARTITRNVHSKMNSVASEDRKLTGGRNAVGIQNYYMGTLDNILEMMSKSPARAMQMYEDLMKNKFSVYHEGGFVGGYAGLRGNEEFAKLMKTEFVSTPTQIQHFMNRTLPQIASGGGSAASQEFNAPLIEINCESVTSESMPMLKEIVDEAVAEVKRCLDGGMSRTGYKRTVKKLLT